MKVWLDDERPMPPEYDVHCKTVQECVPLLQSGQVTHISLDNHLGAGLTKGKALALWIETQARLGQLKRLVCNAHTGDSVALCEMYKCFENAKKYWNDWEASVRA